MAKTHLCLVSGQPVPNLLPLLIRHHRPQRVVLMQSQEMKNQGGWLRAVMQDLGCRVEVRPIAPYDVAAARAAVEAAVDALAGDEVTLNVTGGTKLMALAAFSAFREKGLPILYVDTDSNRLRILSPAVAEDDLPDILPVAQYLRAYGYRVGSTRSLGIPPAWRSLAQELVAKVAELSGAIGAVNALAARAKAAASLCAALDQGSGRPGSPLARLLDRCAGAGLFRCRGSWVEFASQEALEFANGGWLEYHVYEVVQSLQTAGAVRDLRVGAHVESSQGVPNELDVVFTARNRLHLIECKTKAWNRDGQAVETEPVYKLDSLRDVVGGLFARAMLVSYRDLPRYTVERCRDLRIETVAGTELRNLKERIQGWVAR